MPSRTILLLILLGAGVAGCGAGAARPTDAPAAARAAAEAREDSSPEQVLRKFYVAILALDVPTIRRLALPHPRIEVLWEMTDKPEPAELDFAARWIRLAPLRRARVGETLVLPGDHQLPVTAHDVNDGRVLILMDDDPLPFTFVRIDGRWRVDPDLLIVMRLKADEIRRRKKAEDPPPDAVST